VHGIDRSNECGPLGGGEGVLVFSDGHDVPPYVCENSTLAHTALLNHGLRPPSIHALNLSILSCGHFPLGGIIGGFAPDNLS
jgi:hypothetical protein